MNRLVVLSFLAALASGASGCASAHYVSKQGDTGTVAIPSNSNYWPFHYRQNAEELIRQHVGPNFEIVDEQQVVTGVNVTNNEQTQRDLVPNKRNPNMPGERETTTGSVTSSNITEWHITYRKKYVPVVNDISNKGAASGVAPASGSFVVPPLQPNAQPLAPRQP